MYYKLHLYKLDLLVSLSEYLFMSICVRVRVRVHVSMNVSVYHFIK